MTNATRCYAVPLIIGVMTLSTRGAEPAAADVETISLGGPSKVTVAIERSAERFVATVEMKPVAYFDDSTNRSVNRAKAELYALVGFCQSRFGRAKGLSQDLLGSGRVDAVFRGITVEQDTPLADRFRLKVFIPEDGIAKPVAVQTATAPSRATLELRRAKGDHEANIHALGRALADTVATTLDPLLKKHAAETELRPVIDALKTAGVAQFETLRSEMQADLRIFDDDKAALASLIDSTKKRWFDVIEDLVKSTRRE